MSVEGAVAAHYTTGGLLGRIDAALRALGLDPAAVAPDDLSPVEHMHTGGLSATRQLLAGMNLKPGMHVVDIGCGIGGTAREIAARYGARVTGIDLTPELVDVATELSRRTGFGRMTAFRTGSALALPLPDGCADAAVTLHAAMNIADKAGLMREAHRILKPGALFGVCDVMLGPLAGPLVYPVPWAAGADTSFPEPPETYRALAAEAGFEPVSELDYYTEQLKQPANRGAPDLPVLGPHLMMGSDARIKVANHRANMAAGRVTPVLMIFRRGGAS